MTSGVLHDTKEQQTDCSAIADGEQLGRYIKRPPTYPATIPDDSTAHGTGSFTNSSSSCWYGSQLFNRFVRFMLVLG